MLLRRLVPGGRCCLAFTLPQVAILMLTKKLRGQERALEEQRANQALHQRLRRIEPVNRSVKRCHIVKDRIRLWKEGVRDLVMERCCALHAVRVRLTLWQPMISSRQTQKYASVSTYVCNPLTYHRE